MSSRPGPAYGAEELKRNYPKHALTSFGVSSLLLILVFFYPTIRGWFDNTDDTDQIKVKASKVINYSQLSAPPPIDLERVEPKTLKAAPKIKKVKFLQPVAKKDEEVPDEIEVPTFEEMEHAQIGTVDQDGLDSIVVDVDFVVELPPEPEPEAPLAIVQEMPYFPGGDAGLLEFLGSEISYPAQAFDVGIQGIVFVQFVVETDGSVSNVKVVRGVTESLDKEAVRVIKKMPRWKPGKQNGKEVRVVFSIPIRFVIR